MQRDARTIMATTACMGDYSCCQVGKSRIISITPRAQQPYSSLGRAWQRLRRIALHRIPLSVSNARQLLACNVTLAYGDNRVHAMGGYSCCQVGKSRIFGTATVNS